MFIVDEVQEEFVLGDFLMLLADSERMSLSG